MKKIEVVYDRTITWNEILSWFEPLKFASNLTRYNFGEELPKYCKDSFEAFKELLKEYDLSVKDVVFMPIYAYIHGDIAFSTGCFCDMWDSGVAGYLWTEKKEYLKNIGRTRFTKKVREKFENEVEDLVKCLNSNSYYVKVYEKNEDEPIVEFDIMLEYEDEDRILKEISEMKAINNGEEYQIEWIY
ncbi:hypothetical protein [Caminibacter sp.]